MAEARSVREPEADRGAVKSADRVLEFFELLGRWGDEVTHSEACARLDIPKSSATQLFRSLLGRGYVEYLPSTKRYRAGPALGQLLPSGTSRRDLTTVARPALLAVTAETRESSAINVVEADGTMVLDSVDSDQQVVSHMRAGDRAPLHATSSGKLFLAFGEPEATAAYLARADLDKVTPNTITSASALRHELDRVRAARLAHAFEEFTIGIVGTAVPVFDAGGAMIAALNVAIPAVRFREPLEAACVAALRREARLLEQRLALAAD